MEVANNKKQASFPGCTKKAMDTGPSLIRNLVSVEIRNLLRLLQVKIKHNNNNGLQKGFWYNVMRKNHRQLTKDEPQMNTVHEGFKTHSATTTLSARNNFKQGYLL